MSKRRLVIVLNPWGWDVEWYDGEGTYVIVDELRAYQIPFALVRLWWEVRRG